MQSQSQDLRDEDPDAYTQETMIHDQALMPPPPPPRLPVASGKESDEMSSQPNYSPLQPQHQEYSPQMNPDDDDAGMQHPDDQFNLDQDVGQSQHYDGQGQNEYEGQEQRQLAEQEYEGGGELPVIRIFRRFQHSFASLVDKFVSACY
jgi:hypothetical protein